MRPTKSAIDPQGTRGSGETTATLLTPPGAGAIGVIRVRGEAVHEVVRSCCGQWDTRQPARAESHRADPGRIRLRTIVDGAEAVDEVVLSDVGGADVPAVDLCAHGGIRVLERILQLLQRRGVRIQDGGASPVDAFESSSLLEQEALVAMPLATTEAGVLFLARQRMRLPVILRELLLICATHPARVRRELEGIRSGWPSARLLLRGATVALVGPPNAGKSSLFNALAGRAASVVTPIAGTTRDWVTAEVEFDGVPITLLDTAGRRRTDSDLESVAVRRGRSRSQAADLRVSLCDLSGTPRDPECVDSASDPDEDSRSIAALRVWTKADLLPVEVPVEAAMAAAVGGDADVAPGEIATSAKTGVGLPAFRAAVLSRLGWDPAVLVQPTLFAERQACVVCAALASPDNILYKYVADLIGDRSVIGRR